MKNILVKIHAKFNSIAISNRISGGAPNSFESELKRGINQAINWLTENHKKIMENFDPKVVKLQKKRKVIFAPEAVDDLNKMLDDEF